MGGGAGVAGVVAATVGASVILGAAVVVAPASAAVLPVPVLPVLEEPAAFGVLVPHAPIAKTNKRPATHIVGRRVVVKVVKAIPFRLMPLWEKPIP